jgi:hypothetical protein
MERQAMWPRQASRPYAEALECDNVTEIYQVGADPACQGNAGGAGLNAERSQAEESGRAYASLSERGVGQGFWFRMNVRLWR